jgi:hypothetical protein
MPQNHDRAMDFNTSSLNGRLNPRPDDLSLLHELIEENIPGMQAQIQVEPFIRLISFQLFISYFPWISVEKGFTERIFTEE